MAAKLEGLIFVIDGAAELAWRILCQAWLRSFLEEKTLNERYVLDSVFWGLRVSLRLLVVLENTHGINNFLTL